ncbi:hypothetical protein BUALT_Bualt16G0099600 [Buddleja alternifolia]|uniref:Aminotransferase-like plant mobile domain-containing protein n=1 Tax=Buddleja alternifolia TaxID=168488 RepID=A0AAV6WAG8_9LAMI|nr:hypothetical protein BUALT_Bualt16G0099600 [Buddleja alternifolia]
MDDSDGSKKQSKKLGQAEKINQDSSSLKLKEIRRKMYFEDQSEPIPSLVIRYDKDSLKVKSTMLPVYEPAIDGHLTNTRSLAKSTHISVWSEEAAKGCVDLRSGASSNSKVILLRSSLHDTKSMDTEFLLPHQHLHSRPVRYKEPPLRTTRKRTTRPKLSHNPCGDVDRSLLPRAKEHDEPFKILDIDAEIREETYVAAFISCWLCSFVLPHHQTYRIRATVFKVASRMARGEHFSLAIPVLASIYRGLRIISSSKDLGESTAIFPIHYVYGWIGCYLPTHFYSRIKTVGAQMVKYAGEGMANYFDLEDARILFHKVNPSTIRILLSHQKEQISLIDGSNLSSQYKDLFVSLRSAYLTFRHGREHIVESYSPHRFSRQYNFCQDIPGLLQNEILTCDLKELVQLWRSCTLLSTSSRLNLPGNTSSPPLVTKEYADWWAKCWKASLAKSTKVIVKINLKEKEPASEKSKNTLKQPSSHNQEAALDEMIPTDGDEIISALSCSNEDYNDQWQLRKRPKVLDLDNISINSQFFEDVPSSTLPLRDLAQYLANLEAKVPATSKDSAGSVNEVNPFNLPETNSPPHSSGNGVQVTLENENHERPQISLPPRVTEELHADENTGKKPKRSFEAPSWPLAHPEASQFSPNTIRSEAEKMLLSFYWSRICQKISKTLFEQLPEIKSDIDILIGDMKKFVQDTSTLERLLKSFFEDASSYAQVKSAYAQRETQKSHEEALKSAQQSLTEAEAQENEQAKDIKSQNDNLQRIHQQQEELRKQLAELEQNEESVNISFRKAKENLSKTREDVATQKETVLKLEKTPYLSDREVEALERMKSFLEESRENLKAFDLSS